MHKNSRIRRDRKQREADERQARYDAMTIAEKVASTVSREGASLRQLTRLQALSSV